MGAKNNGKGKSSGQLLKPSQKQGAKELKANYQIDTNTKVLGSGAFGKVFMTFNKNLTDFKVAIKVMNKSKLKDHIEAI